MSKAVDDARDRFIKADASHKRNRQDDSLWADWQRLGAEYWVLRHPELERYRNLEADRPLEAREIVGLAHALRQAIDGVPSSWRLGPWTPTRAEHSAQLAWFHELHRALYGPVGHALEHARKGSTDGIETLVRFLEADPFCYRSGYWKADIIKTITRMDLDPPTRKRLADVLFAIVKKPTKREFRRYVRLARYLDSEDLRARLGLMQHGDAQPAARHATWILAELSRDAVSPPPIKLGE